MTSNGAVASMPRGTCVATARLRERQGGSAGFSPPSLGLLLVFRVFHVSSMNSRATDEVLCPAPSGLGQPKRVEAWARHASLEQVGTNGCLCPHDGSGCVLTVQPAH